MKRNKSMWLLPILFLSLLLGLSSEVTAQSQDTDVNQGQTSVNIIQGGSPSQQIVNNGRPIPANSGPGVGLPSLAYYIGKINWDGRYWSLEDNLQFKREWTFQEAQNFLKSNGKVVDNAVFWGDKEIMPTPESSLIIVPVKPKNGKELQLFNQDWDMIGVSHIGSEKSANSFKVMGAAIDIGLKNGAELILFNQGAFLLLEASSLGIGLNPSVSMTGAGTGTFIGGIGAGGMGYVKAKTGYHTYPWLQAQFFVRKDRSRPGYIPPLVPEGRIESSEVNGGNKSKQSKKTIPVTTDKN